MNKSIGILGWAILGVFMWYSFFFIIGIDLKIVGFRLSITIEEYWMAFIIVNIGLIASIFQKRDKNANLRI